MFSHPFNNPYNAALNTAIETYDWELILNMGDANAICQNFMAALLSIFNAYVPNHEKIIKPKDMPWFNAIIKRAINKRNRCHRKISKDNSVHNVRAFKEECKNVKNLVFNAKRAFQNKLCESLNENSSGTKNYWHILRQLLGKKCDTGIPTLTVNNTILDTDTLKSNS
jgi:hypothetical protein